MSLISLCSPYFESHIKTRGSDYQARGKVEIFEDDEDTLAAKVRGSYIYLVRLYLDMVDSVDIVAAECSCPYYKSHGFCKHIWAVILEGQHSCFAQEFLYFEDIDMTVRIDDYGRYQEAPRYELSYEMDNVNEYSRERIIQRDSISRDWKSVFEYLPSQKVVVSQEERRIKRVLYSINSSSYFSCRGELAIDLYYQQLNKTGKWSTKKVLNMDMDKVDIFTDSTDRKLLKLLWGFKRDYNSDSYSYYGHVQPKYRGAIVSQEFCKDVLSQIAKSDQLYIDLDSISGEDDKISLDLQESTSIIISLQEIDDKNHYQIEAKFEKDKKSYELFEIKYLAANGLILFENILSFYNPISAYPLVESLFSGAPIVVPRNEILQFLKSLSSIVDLSSVELPEGFDLKLVCEVPKPIFKLRVEEIKKEISIIGEILFEYSQDQIFSPSIEYGADIIDSRVDSTGGQLFLRNKKSEKSLSNEFLKVEGISKRNNTYDSDEYILDADSSPNILNQLVKLGWQVIADNRKLKQMGKSHMSVSSGVDWFDLSCSVNFEDSIVELPAILKAARAKQFFIELSDGSVGMLPSDWVKKIARLAKLGNLNEDALRFKGAQALFLNAFLNENKGVDVDEVFEKVQNNFKNLTGVIPQQVGSNFQGELWNYQRDGLGWLEFLQKIGLGGCLADDMGLGKTIQVLAMLDKRKSSGKPKHPSLLIAPKTLLVNWQREAARFTPKLKVVEYFGLNRKNLIDRFNDVDLIITSYGTVRRDALALRKLEFDYIILDEAQNIKNSKSQTAKSCKVMRSAHKLAMTGTPVENHLGELFSLFDFLNPGLVGKSAEIRNGSIEDNTIKDILTGLRPLILRRKKDDVLTDLPSKTECVLYCDMEKNQKEIYDKVKGYYQTHLQNKIKEEGYGKSKIHFLEGLLRLRQVACHPALVNKKFDQVGSAKLAVLFDKLDELISAGHKALIFSQFTSLLAIVRSYLDDRKINYQYLDGQTNDRQSCVDSFQNDPKCPLFLISLKAGGVGLNLTSADYCFILDPWWNPAVEAQAIDRIHRIGQKNNVVAYRIIARDTIEEKILNLQNNKRDLADGIMSSDGGFLKNLSKDDFNYLFT